MEFVSTFLLADFMGKATWLWLMFVGIVIALLVFDLGVLNRKDHEIGVRESLWLSAGYIAIAIGYGAWIWWYIGAQPGTEYFTGFLIEKSLAMDNVFVIALIFSYFAIPRVYQHRVLFWGILGVIVLRGIMIALGATLVEQFNWVLYIFGAFLIITGIKMLWMVDNMPDIGNNPLLRFLRKRFRVTDEIHGNAFTVTKPDPKTGKMVRYGTPLLLALVLVEFADLIFAVDSVPAIFAILGLRALYFALAAIIHRFKYLKYALSAVLVFIGLKIFYNQIWGKMDPMVSLSVTFGLLAIGVIVSLWKTRNEPAPPMDAQHIGEAVGDRHFASRGKAPADHGA